MTAVARREERIVIDSVVLPFLGSRGGDHQPFQYLLRDVSAGGVQVALPQWVASRERLRQGESINFHLPFMLDERVLDAGEVAWERWDQEEETQFVGAALNRIAPVYYPIYLRISSQQVNIDLQQFDTAGELFGRVLKDSLLLKRGILIYLKHLTAYFSRVGGMSEEDWELFRESVLEDVRSRVESNAARLSQWCAQCLEDSPVDDHAVTMLDMEELRQAMEPELYLDLFRSALGNATAHLYLEAIKELEKRLFANHNTLVMLYIRAL